MEELALRIEHVSKQYRLGTIGGGTLKGDLQSWWARKRGQEDPNSKIGSDLSGRIGERFWALDDVSFEVKKGEAVGIIGHNGAGKSTLFKLLSRVTAPTEGKISINGRIASMLEVGTGFHPELTGRENVYMNGAILGMTRAEIDKKFDQIVEFAEMEKFIDTPVKRYSSGMYVKLAFSVAAHLDSEIMIMDEVLAVGDMAFQKKCLDKMREAAKQEGRTVLYVSHNMNTIRQLCDRCIVLDHGKVIYNGEVDEAISLYLGTSNDLENHYIYKKEHHKNLLSTDRFVINELYIKSNSGNRFEIDDKITLLLKIYLKQKYTNVRFRFVFSYRDGTFAGTMLSSNAIDLESAVCVNVNMNMDLKSIMPGRYRVDIIAFQFDDLGHESVVDGVYPGFFIEIDERVNAENPLIWLHQYWGHIRLEDVEIMVL